MPLFWLSLAFIAGILLAANAQLPSASWMLLAGASLVLAIFLRFLRIRFSRSQNPDHPIGHRFSLFTRHFLRFTHYVSRFSHYVLRFIALLPPIPYTFLPLFLFLGAARYQSVQPDLSSPNYIASYNDTGALLDLEGILIRPPEIGDGYADLEFQAEEIRIGGDQATKPVEGVVSARVWEDRNWKYGDRLHLEGRLVTPPVSEDFSFQAYLAHRGVYSRLEVARATFVSSGGGNPILRLIYTYKEHALATAYRLWPDPEASLFGGILLGVESGIPEEVYQAFRDTGTAHVIVISGFNITILAGLLVGVFSRVLGRGQFGVRRGVAVAMAGIFLYAILVGGEAAVVRAAIMGGLGLFASQVGRRQAGLNSLAIVAAFMCIFNPHVLWDLGFQLSFAATLGLILYATPLQEGFVRFAERYVPQELARKLARPAGEYFLFTLAAQLLVVPISLYYFQQLPLVSLVANPLILPAQPPVMILGGLATLLGTIYFPLGKVFGWLAWPFAAYTIRVVELFSGIPGGVIATGGKNLAVLILFFVGVFSLTFAAPRVRGLARRIPLGIGLAGLATLTVLVWRGVFAAPDGRLRLTLLDVGTGDGILIQTPSGRAVLIDGGPSTQRLSDQLGRFLPFGERGLDWLVVAAADVEQIGGLPRNLDRFPPTDVLWAGPTHATREARALQDVLAGAGIRPVRVQAGQELDLGDGSRLRVLTAGELGAVLMLEWGDFRALLPVGLDFETLDRLRGDPTLGPVTVLLLAQNGFAPINPGEWIELLHPQVVLLSASASDPRGLPSPETLEAVAGYSLLRTDLNGWIELTTDGERMWVEVERR